MVVGFPVRPERGTVSGAGGNPATLPQEDAKVGPITFQVS